MPRHRPLGGQRAAPSSWPTQSSTSAFSWRSGSLPWRRGRIDPFTSRSCRLPDCSTWPPAAAIERFNTALRVALKDPSFVARMTELGADVVPESKQSPEGLKTWLTSEIGKWGPVIRAAGVYAD